jgi:hypothetical protein
MKAAPRIYMRVHSTLNVEHLNLGHFTDWVLANFIRVSMQNAQKRYECKMKKKSPYKIYLTLFSC